LDFLITSSIGLFQDEVFRAVLERGKKLIQRKVPGVRLFISPLKRPEYRLSGISGPALLPYLWWELMRQCKWVGNSVSVCKGIKKYEEFKINRLLSIDANCDCPIGAD
jgi:hypothetical protein